MGYFSDNAIDNGDEWDRVSDIGGDMADMDFAEDYYVNTEDMREMRKRMLIGKYVIICDSRHADSGIRFLQDQNIAVSFVGHYWTNYIENAKGYTDITAAFVRCKNLLYNNPRVVYVTAEYKLKEVDRFGHFKESTSRSRIHSSGKCNDKTNRGRIRTREDNNFKGHTHHITKGGQYNVPTCPICTREESRREIV